MRTAVLGFLIALTLSVVGGWAAADEPGLSASDRGANEAVISRQLDAFRRDDGAAAFAFACLPPDASAMQQLLGTTSDGTRKLPRQVDSS